MNLPTLEIDVTAKIDTGAKTSALSVTGIKLIEINGEKMVSFKVRGKKVTLPLITTRKIKSSNGHTELRPVIKTTLIMDQKKWEVEITLTNRKSMKYPMLLGKQALISNCIVDVSYSYLTKK